MIGVGRRVVLIVLDGVGIGELPDADEYGDRGSNSIANTARVNGGIHLPHMGLLGLGNIATITGVPPVPLPSGAFGKMAERSRGKDTMVGHWELAGVLSAQPQPVYPNGFPREIVEAFSAAIGRGILGNKPASGTVIIEELGGEGLRTGKPIVYTSGDSVFQVAAHIGVIPLEELYRWCEVARALLVKPHEVGRVIARPFRGVPGAFVRTPDRRDWALQPPYPTLLDVVQATGQAVAGVGKIEDIFVQRGLTASNHTHTNMESVDATLAYLETVESGLIFANLIECDMIFGHRNDVAGYAGALEAFDRRVPELLAALRPDDVLMVTGDHGVDPTTPGTDHSREYVPLLVCGPQIKPGIDLGIRDTFADAGQTAAQLLGACPLPFGTSFAGQITSA